MTFDWGVSTAQVRLWAASSLWDAGSAERVCMQQRRPGSGVHHFERSAMKVCGLHTPWKTPVLTDESATAPASLQEPSWGEEEGDEGEGSAAAPPRLYQQIFILQGYCNRGTLFDAVERGQLKTSDGAPNLESILETGGPG